MDNRIPAQDLDESGSHVLQGASVSRRSLDPKTFSAFIGYFLLAASSLVATALIFPRGQTSAPADGKELAWLMQNYADKAIACLFIIFFSLIGLQLLGAAGRPTPRAIPPEDRALLEPLVRDANKEAISQYVILSSLSGFTGNFQKIGFSGLPLATAALTLLFCGLAFAKPEFIEFAKLTLGAFIGSFVQRSADTERLRETVRSEVQSEVSSANFAPPRYELPQPQSISGLSSQDQRIQPDNPDMQ
jgi:hypothetical protein